MKTSMYRASGAAVAMAIATAASAGTFSANINQSIFGSNYNINIYRVGSDIVGRTGAGPTAGRLEPEGMVFHNGVLYVSGDGSSSETNGHLAAYAGGDLSASPSVLGRYDVTVGSNAAPIGSEGITVNTRGAGYGSFSSGPGRIVSVDNVVSPVSTRVLAVQDLGSTAVNDVNSGFAVNSDDVAYVPGADAASDRFAFIDGTDLRDNAGSSAYNRVVYCAAGATPGPTGQGFNVPIGAKGLLHLSAADAALFAPGVTTDALLVAFAPASDAVTLDSFGNRLALYSVDGQLIAQSNIITGSGIVGRFGAIEALAFDSATKRLFLGDEASGNSQIAVFTVPAPGAAALGLGMVFFAGRRRR